MNVHDHGGILDALANFYFTRIKIADAGNTKNVAEYNLFPGAEEALDACLLRRGVTPDFFASGFEFGLYVARILMENPFGCEAILRTMLDKKAQELKADGAPLADVVADEVES